MKKHSMTLCVLLTAAGFAAAEEPKAPKNAQFDRIKALAGTWEVKSAPGEHMAPSGTVTYKVTSGGSAVVETQFGGTEHEMVSVYCMEGEHLAMTHYCILHNQPHMFAKAQADPNKISFSCIDGKDPKLDASAHMHAVTFTFQDADHLKAEWTMYKDGKAEGTHSFELARKKQ